MSQPPSKAIASKANATFKGLLALTTSQGIKEAGQVLVAGGKIVAEALAGAAEPLFVVVRDGRRAAMLEPFPQAATLPVVELSGELFREIDVVGTGGPLLVARAPPLDAWDPAVAWPLGCTLFIAFQNPENVGAALRSAAAFGVARVVLLKGAAHPFLPKALRASSAAAFRVPLALGPTLAELLAAPSGAPFITLDARGEDLRAAPFPAVFGLIPGVEGPGFPDGAEAAWRRRIPMEPGVESLNAAVATAIALYAWRSALPPPTHSHPPS